MIETLDDVHLFAAGLDVFDGVPKVNPALVAHPRVVHVPHLGSATRHTRPAMANLAARNVRLCWRATRRSHRFLVDLMALHP